MTLDKDKVVQAVLQDGEFWAELDRDLHDRWGEDLGLDGIGSLIDFVVESAAERTAVEALTQGVDDGERA